jgi:hypothetical protein
MSNEMTISRSIRTCRLSNGHISNLIAMANCSKFKLPGLDERDVPLIKRQCVNTTAARSTRLFNTITSDINATTVTTSKFIPKGMKVKFSRSYDGKGEVNHSTPSVCRLSKGRNSNILGTV